MSRSIPRTILTSSNVTFHRLRSHDASYAPSQNTCLLLDMLLTLTYSPIAPNVHPRLAQISDFLRKNCANGICQECRQSLEKWGGESTNTHAPPSRWTNSAVGKGGSGWVRGQLSLNFIFCHVTPWSQRTLNLNLVFHIIMKTYLSRE